MMTAAIHVLPDNGFALARATLRSDDASREHIAASCDVLAASHRWEDIELVRQKRNVLWSTPDSETRSYPPLTVAECEAVGTIIAADNRRRRAASVWPTNTSISRPTMTPRRHADLTGFLAGTLVLMLTLFLVTAAGSHVQDRADETVAQGMAMRGM